jgi:protein-disulfide isomerase-like protein with CxxC motif
VVEADLVQRRRRGEGRDVAADAVLSRLLARTTIAIAFQRWESASFAAAAEESFRVLLTWQSPDGHGMF